jgi:SAM-dependent methyltransferase
VLTPLALASPNCLQAQEGAIKLNFKMGADPSLVAYEAFAPVYNAFNHSNDYEMWLGQTLLPALRRHGLKEGGAALDIGCGTGRAFRPLLQRGWRVQGCDLSPAMLELAAQEGGQEVDLRVADMRSLPQFGHFDLVLSLNDSVDHLLGDGDLILALRGMRKNLAENGLLVFDVNARPVYSTGYAAVKEVEHEGARWVWRGRGEVAPSIFEAEISGDRLDEPIRNLERLRSVREVLDSMRIAGLTTLAALGMSETDGKIVLSTPIDESRDYKLVFIGTATPGADKYSSRKNGQEA